MKPATRDVLLGWALAFVVFAVWPRSARREQWAWRRVARGALQQVALSAVVDVWLRPRMQAAEHLKAELRAELGREPTTDEVMSRLMAPRAA